MDIDYRRINHLTIAVPAGEHQKVRAFYGGVLGLKEVERPEALNKVYDLIWYEWMEILLHLDFTPPWTKPAENRHLAVEVKQIHTVRAYLEQQGAEILEAVPMPDRERYAVLGRWSTLFGRATPNARIPADADETRWTHPATFIATRARRSEHADTPTRRHVSPTSGLKIKRLPPYS
jgi:catechol 2,3-dioxygenase-like lactoylglutathione lyase family enzyme